MLAHTQTQARSHQRFTHRVYDVFPDTFKTLLELSSEAVHVFSNNFAALSVSLADRT